MLLLGCGRAPPAQGPRIVRAPEPSASEAYCAWYGDARDGLLYFGQAPFWSALRAAGGDARADLLHAGPQLIGRFDLESESLRPPLDVGEPGARSGVWDVHAHANGWVYYTTYFEAMGRVDPANGRVERFDALGSGLNEIAPGPGDSLLVSRYGPSDARRGSVLQISAAGERLAEWPLEPPPGYTSAPKTVAFDPVHAEIWATTDLLPDRAGAPVRHDAYVLDLAGRELRRSARPELQFVAFDARGEGILVEAEGAELWIERRSAGAGPRRTRVADDFRADVDFAQDAKLAADGSALVTRWSGFVHRVTPEGAVSTRRLPAGIDAGGLYYTGALHGSRVCASYCGAVRVVCDDAP